MKINLNKSIFNLVEYIALLLIIGFPRLPGLDVPICVFLFPIYFKPLVKELKNIIVLKLLIFLCIFLIYGFIIWMVSNNSYINDLKFLISIFIKFVLTIFMGIIVADIIIRKPRLLLYWIITQTLLILISILSAAAFDALVIFSGSTGYDVYSQIGGLRGIGFGVVHVYGAYTLICACALYFCLTNGISKNSNVISLSIAIIMSFFVARTSLIVAVISLLFTSLKKFIIFIVLFILFAYLFSLYGDNDNIIYQILEPGVNYFNTGVIYTASTNANLEMIKFPVGIINWMVGYGKFFDDGLFFMETDLGYSRLTLFGGIGFSIIYLIINLYPIIKGYILAKKNGAEIKSKYKLLLIIYGASFVIINSKGLLDIGLFAIVTFFMVCKRTANCGNHE